MTKHNVSPLLTKNFTTSVIAPDGQDTTLSKPLPGTDVDAYCVTLSQASSLHAFNATIHRLIGEMGFTDFHFSPSTTMENNLLLSLSTIPVLMERYIEEKLYACDQLLQHGSQAREPFYLSCYKEAAEIFPYSHEMLATRKTIALFEQNQFFNTLTLPIPSCNNPDNVTLMVMSKGVSADTFKQCAESHKINLIRLVDAIYGTAQLKFPELFSSKNQLKHTRAKKPFQALSWASQGYSHKQVAVKMHISTKTVNDHLRAAREYLNVKSTSHAIRVALLTGMIR